MVFNSSSRVIAPSSADVYQPSFGILDGIKRLRFIQRYHRPDIVWAKRLHAGQGRNGRLAGGQQRRERLSGGRWFWPLIAWWDRLARRQVVQVLPALPALMNVV